MVWVFKKGERQLRCEVSRTDAPASYHLIVMHHDRTRTVETLADPAALVDRLAAVMLDIRGDGWQLA